MILQQIIMDPHFNFEPSHSVSESVNITYNSESALAFLGHDERYLQQGNSTLGYVQVGEWRDVILLPPLANITVIVYVYALCAVII